MLSYYNIMSFEAIDRAAFSDSLTITTFTKENIIPYIKNVIHIYRQYAYYTYKRMLMLFYRSISRFGLIQASLTFESCLYLTCSAVLNLEPFFSIACLLLVWH